MSRKKRLLPQACVPSTSFLKKFANVRLALTIERLPKSLISYPDLFLTKQALSIRDLGTRLRHHKINVRSNNGRNLIRPNLFLDSPRSRPKLDRAIMQHSTVTNETTVQRLFDIFYSATIRTGVLERRLSNYNVF